MQGKRRRHCLHHVVQSEEDAGHGCGPNWFSQAERGDNVIIFYCVTWTAVNLSVSVTGCQCQNEWHSNSASWCIAVCMASALNTSRKTSSSCPRFSLASDCARPPVPTSWFLPHAGLHLATEQELERGMHCRPVSPPHHLCPHSGDFWRHFFSSDNGVNNTNYCVVVLKCLALSTALILANWTELNYLTVLAVTAWWPSG